ncbi:MAG: EI24 domain-containing protein [Planctomycetes bacterium]|nr:EI24 domain-containing protein [Planctomycetota bacterium]
MSKDPVVPCPLCGYHAPELSCPSCRLAPREPTLVGGRGRTLREFLDGLRAVPQGARMLLSIRGTKRLLVPPLILTALLFGAILALLVRWMTGFFDAVRNQDLGALGIDPGFWSRVIEWLAGLQVVIAIAQAGSLLVLMTAFTVAALWTFSIAYELVCGPFLDTIQARVEAAWFGADPRVALEQPPGIDPVASARAAAVAASVAGLAIVAWAWIDARWSWALLVLVPLAFLVAARRVPGSWSWTRWFARSQARALWTSVKASTLAAVVLVLFLWLKFVPFLGLPLFAMVAGFATALTLLDIPFSRRGWSLRQRVRFLFQHLAAVVALGVVTSLVFVVPILGPLVGVPCASIGGQWLLCRLDKNAMRPPGRRLTLPA